MKLNYQYRIYPFKEQAEKFNAWLRICRYLYNRWVGQGINWWETHVCSINSCSIVKCDMPILSENPFFTDLKKELPLLKKDLVLVKSTRQLLDLSEVYSTVLQDVYESRVKPAIKRFIQGDKNGKKSGKPRFKTEASYKSFKFANGKNEWLDVKNHVLKLPFIGGIQIRLHRALPSGFQLKTVQIIKKADGWYATLCLEEPTVPTFTPDEIVPTWDNSIGIDAVLYGEDYLATSQHEKLPSVKSFRRNQEKLALISQRKAKAKKGSKRRRKLAKREARIHQQIANSRRDHAYKTAHKLVRTGKKVFIHEDLNLTGLTKRNQAKQSDSGRFLPNNQSQKSGLNKSWLDAAFGQAFTILEYIAAKAGARTLAVNPAYTSQLLSYRDEVVFTDCGIREYWDEHEQIRVDRDINSAINLKRVGLELFPTVKNSRSGKVKITCKNTNPITTKEILGLFRQFQKPTPSCTQAV